MLIKIPKTHTYLHKTAAGRRFFRAQRANAQASDAWPSSGNERIQGEQWRASEVKQSKNYHSSKVYRAVEYSLLNESSSCKRGSARQQK